MAAAFLQVGLESSINPTDFQKKHKLRWVVNQSIQHEVHIKEYKNFDLSLEDQMKNTIINWSKQRQGPQIHLGNIDYFNDDSKKRIFYAQQKDKIIGLLLLTPVDRYQGWVIGSHLAVLDAPVGTTEHLICSACDSLAHEKCQFLCLGAVSKDQLDEIVGLGSFGTNVAHLIFKMAKRLFKLDSKAVYLHKFHPNLRSIYLLFKEKLTVSNCSLLKTY